ncbi:MAG: hypothetical protein WD601_14335 [Pseudohongiellaceae bacterium]
MYTASTTHILYWCDDGEISLDNLILLCRHHHRPLHQEGKHKTGAVDFVTPGSENREAPC